MKILVTGSLGLVGSEAVKYYLNNACEVIGVDNDMRKHFFGESASVLKNRIDHSNYTHMGVDMASKEVEDVFQNWKPDVVIHAGAQTSSVWSIKNPLVDFGINAYSTLMLLEMTKKYVPEAVFVYLANTDDMEASPMQASKWAGEIYTLLYGRSGLVTGIFKCKDVVSRGGTTDQNNVANPIHARDVAKMIYAFVKDPDPCSVYVVNRDVSNIVFSSRYPNFKFDYNEWAAREAVR